MKVFAELLKVLYVKLKATITGAEDTEWVEPPFREKKLRRSTGFGRITDDEFNFVWKEFKKTNRVPCINCQKYWMFKGPEGGMSINLRCGHCGQGVNFTAFGKSKGALKLENIGIDADWISDDQEKIVGLKIN